MTEIYETMAMPMENLWVGLLGVLGYIVAALAIFIIGLIIASILGSVVRKLVEIIKLDELLKKMGVEKYFQRAEISLNSGKFFGKFTFWFFVIVSLLAASEILGLTALTLFLHDVLLYIPNILVAVLIMLAAIVVANFLRNMIKSSVKGAKLHGHQFLGSLSWWAVIIFGFLAAVSQLGVAQDLIHAIVVGFVAMFALAGGIAFGLGGKDYAAKLVKKMEEGQ